MLKMHAWIFLKVRDMQNSNGRLSSLELLLTRDLFKGFSLLQRFMHLMFVVTGFPSAPVVGGRQQFYEFVIKAHDRRQPHYYTLVD